MRRALLKIKWLRPSLRSIFLMALLAVPLAMATSAVAKDLPLYEIHLDGYPVVSESPLHDVDQAWLKQLLNGAWVQAMAKAKENPDTTDFAYGDGKYHVFMRTDFEMGLVIEVVEVATSRRFMTSLENITQKKNFAEYAEKRMMESLRGLDTAAYKPLSMASWALAIISRTEGMYHTMVNEWMDLREGKTRFLSDKDFKDQYVDKNKVKMTLGLQGERLTNKDLEAKVPVLGEAEVNWMDGAFFVRVLDRESDKVIIYYEKGSIDFKSPHAQQYLARQHIKAGRYRRDGGSGRDVILMEVDKFEAIEDTSVFYDTDRYAVSNRHARFSQPWWEDIWSAVKISLDSWKVSYGVIHGAFLGGLSYIALQAADAISSLMGYGGLTTDIVFTSLAIGVYSVVFGVFDSFVNNLVYFGPDWQQRLKSRINASLFLIYSMILLEGGNVDFTSFFMWTAIALEWQLSPRGKQNWYRIVSFRNEAGSNRNVFRLPVVRGFRHPKEWFQKQERQPSVKELMQRIDRLGDEIQSAAKEDVGNAASIERLQEAMSTYESKLRERQANREFNMLMFRVGWTKGGWSQATLERGFYIYPIQFLFRFSGRILGIFGDFLTWMPLVPNMYLSQFVKVKAMEREERLGRLKDASLVQELHEARRDWDQAVDALTNLDYYELKLQSRLNPSASQRYFAGQLLHDRWPEVVDQPKAPRSWSDRLQEIKDGTKAILSSFWSRSRAGVSPTNQMQDGWFAVPTRAKGAVLSCQGLFFQPPQMTDRQRRNERRQRREARRQRLGLSY